jgi:hypothetical protein
VEIGREKKEMEERNGARLGPGSNFLFFNGGMKKSPNT